LEQASGGTRGQQDRVVGGTGQGDGIWCYLALEAREGQNEGVGGGKQPRLVLGASKWWDKGAAGQGSGWNRMGYVAVSHLEQGRGGTREWAVGNNLVSRLERASGGMRGQQDRVVGGTGWDMVPSRTWSEGGAERGSGRWETTSTHAWSKQVVGRGASRTG
jgi:hypothetical protein